jgi:hypothetical protein
LLRELVGFVLSKRVRRVAVRLKLRIVRGSYSTEVVALLKSGYETSKPELLVPATTARELSLYPQLPQGSIIREYKLADGSVTRLIKVPRAVLVYAVEEDRVVGPVETSIVIAERAEEPLISDKLAGKLGIVVLDFAEGYWCFRDEVGRATRKSK